MIDQETINRIFDTADIVEVISDFVQLKRSGSNYKGFSPFANEKTPSFMVSPSKGIFKDFSSGKGGNAVGFLMEHEKLSYPDALRYLAKKYNIEIQEKEKTAEEIQQDNTRESLMVVSEFAQKFFTDKLHKNPEGKAIALKYLQERGISEKLIDSFQLGYNPDAWDAFTGAALEKGYKKDYLVQTGLSVEKGNKLFDRFKGRVIFPIHSLSGSVIGFGGRTLRNDKNVAKYLNSPESEIYHKSRVLYGLFQAKRAIVNAEKCYLVEGYTDVISLHQAGIENVVASSGTALTKEQIRLIKRFSANVTILYDGDEAGIKASFRGIDLILEEGLNLKVLLLPEGEDPDSFSKKHSSSAFKEYIGSHEEDFITFKTRILLEGTKNDPVAKANLITDIVRSVSVIPNAINRSVYIKECSSLLDTDERVLYSEVNKFRKRLLEQKWSSDKTPGPANPDVPVQPQVPSFIERVYSEFEEREIIHFLLKFGDEELLVEENENIRVSEFIIREIQNDNLEFENLVYKKVFELSLSLIERGLPLEEKYFIYHEDPKIMNLAIDIYSSRYEISKVWKRKDTYVELPGDNLGQEVPKALLAYKNRIVSQAIKDLENKINIAGRDGNMEEVQKLQRQFINLKEVQKLISLKLGERTILSM